MARYDYDYDPARRYRRTSEGQYYGRDTDRDFGDRAADEVRSWFGDDSAERRRQRDEMRDEGSTRFRDYGDRSYRSDRYGYSSDANDYRTRGRRGWDEDYGDERSPMSYGRDDEARGVDWGRPHTRDYDREANVGMSYDRGDRNAPYDRYGVDRDYEGPYVGHGPKGYTRSSDRLVDDVNERLTDHGRIDATDIQVSAQNGEVTLEGTVRSRREKRMAEDVAERVRGVRDIHNRLHIQRDDDFKEASDASNASEKTAARKS